MNEERPDVEHDMKVLLARDGSKCHMVPEPIAWIGSDLNRL